MKYLNKLLDVSYSVQLLITYVQFYYNIQSMETQGLKKIKLTCSTNPTFGCSSGSLRVLNTNPVSVFESVFLIYRTTTAQETDHYTQTIGDSPKVT